MVENLLARPSHILTAGPPEDGPQGWQIQVAMEDTATIEEITVGGTALYDDGEVDISDGVRILLFEFGGPPLPLPAPGPIDCGADTTSDALPCLSYDLCP